MLIRLLLITCLIFPALAVADPNLNGVSGTVSDGQYITINGTDFGSNGPTVQIFDDFELGANGNTLLLDAGSAQVGTWDGIDTPAYSNYSNSYSVSGSLSGHWTNQHYSTGINTQFPGNGTDKVFLSYWAYIPSGYSIPANWKIVWLQGSNTGDDDVVYATLIGNGTGLTNGNETGWSATANIGFSIGSWKRVWAYIEGTTTATGTVKQWSLNPSVTQQTTVTDAYIFAADSTPNTNYNFEQVVVNGYFGSGDSGTPCYFDDIYIAYGDYAQARVEIGNDSDYSNCTNLAVITPTSWSDTAISGVVRQGSFADGSTAYVYVFDSNGDYNSTGYEVTLNGTATPINGSCGSADGQTFESTPSSNLCSSGSAGTVTLSDTTYSWDCNGINGGTDDSCTATYSAPVTPTGVFSLSSSTYSVSGSSDYAYITINRDAGDGTATVEWSTTGNTATHGVDYYGDDDVQVSFTPGVTTQQIAIELIDSGATEDRDFAFSIANANTSIGSPSTATVTIDNTGEPTPSGAGAFLSTSGGAWLLSDGSPLTVSE